MSPDVFDKKALIQLRLENAKETLRDAHILHGQGSSPKSIVNRAYYAMFYAALALLVTVDKHSVKQDYSKIDHKKATEVLQSADQFVKSIEEKLASQS